MSMTLFCIIGIIFGTAMVSGENILSKVIQLYKIEHGLVLFFGSSISGKKKIVVIILHGNSEKISQMLACLF